MVGNNGGDERRWCRSSGDGIFGDVGHGTASGRRYCAAWSLLSTLPSSVELDGECGHDDELNYDDGYGHGVFSNYVCIEGEEMQG